jgi:RNA polymerase sigma-70 factor (ECF subfamily)
MKPPLDDTIAELFEEYAPALLLYARQWVGTAADDVVQRVFVQLLAGRKLPADARTWLFRCVRNEAITTWRADERRVRRERSAAEDMPAWFVSSAEDAIDAAAAQRAMTQLPAQQREIVTLRIWSGLTLAQIAEVTGLRTSSVHHQLNEALSTMRQRLESSCKSNPPIHKIKN